MKSLEKNLIFVDGLGAKRISEIISNKERKNILLRRAQKKDVYLYYNLSLKGAIIIRRPLISSGSPGTQVNVPVFLNPFEKPDETKCATQIKESCCDIRFKRHKISGIHNFSCTK